MSVRVLVSRVARLLEASASVSLVWLLLSAHVGTNQVVLEGTAGGYPLRVFIDPPGVVPAQVPIMVRVLEGSPTRITVRAAQWNVGTKGAPPAEDAAPVSGEPGLWSHSLWIMTASSYAVYVAVEGPAGNGELLVPLQTSATRMLGMQRGMGALLVVLGALLVAGLLTIVGAAQRDATLVPGERPSPERMRRGRQAMAVTAALLCIVLLGGSTWWDAEERAYKRRMLRPIETMTSVRVLPAGARADSATSALVLAVTDSLWRTNRYPQLLPDHGKLMHLFVIDADGPRATLAHLHPLRTHADTFVTALPPLPPGRYLVLGDVLFQSGATRTIVDTVELGATTAASAAGGLPGDSVPSLARDDAWRTTLPVPLGTPAPLAGGGTLMLTADGVLSAGRDLRLSATVRDEDGGVSSLEPYMGMSGHAMVLRADGGVFVHLHPAGTASMTAQAQLQRAESGDTAGITPDADAEAHALHATATPAAPPAPSSVAAPAFPFAFPTAGDYLVFVQIRRNGRIETAAFRMAIPPVATR